MRNLFVFIVGILCLSFLFVCATWQMEMKRNNENLLKLEMGMSKEDVITIMGKPTFNEAYQSLYGKSVVILFYYTQRKWADGSYTKDECTPIVFEDGKLVGWGDEFYKTKMEVDINVKHK